jgi:hypothetical protein
MGVRVTDVAGVDVLFIIVVRLGFMGPGLPKNLAAQGVREERLHIGRVGSHHEIQQVRSGRVVGDQVCGRGGDAKVKYLDVAGTLPSGNLAGALGDLLRVVGPGNQDADRAVKYLVHTIQHQIVVVRGQYGGCDLVAAAQY